MPPSPPYLTISPRGSHVVARENSSVAVAVRFKANEKSLDSEIEISQSYLALGYPKGEEGCGGGRGGGRHNRVLHASPSAGTSPGSIAHGS